MGLSRRRRGLGSGLGGRLGVALRSKAAGFIARLSGLRLDLGFGLIALRFGHGGFLGLWPVQDVVNFHAALCSRPLRRRIPNARDLGGRLSV